MTDQIADPAQYITRDELPGILRQVLDDMHLMTEDRLREMLAANVVTRQEFERALRSEHDTQATLTSRMDGQSQLFAQVMERLSAFDEKNDRRSESQLLRETAFIDKVQTLMTEQGKREDLMRDLVNQAIKRSEEAQAVAASVKEKAGLALSIADDVKARVQLHYDRLNSAVLGDETRPPLFEVLAETNAEVMELRRDIAPLLAENAIRQRWATRFHQFITSNTGRLVIGAGILVVIARYTPEVLPWIESLFGG